MIDIDYTLLVQAVNFFLFLLILNFLFFKPLLHAIEKRNKQITDSAKEADNLGVKAEKQLNDYKSKFDEAKKKAIGVRDTIRKEGVLKETDILEEARKTATEYLNKARLEIEKEVSLAKAELHSKTNEIALLISTKVLGRSN